MTTERIGRKSVAGDLPAEDLTPKYEHYCGHTIKEGMDNAHEKGSPNKNDLDPLPMPKVGDNYISVEVLLPLGSVLRQGNVISCKCDADSNTVGWAHDWPILKTHGHLTLSSTMGP
jgi:hypothetical protein